MEAATAQETTASKPALLFIDDEPRVLKSMRAMFRKDYDVYLANSGTEALDVLTNTPIQVVVSDQRMPHMTGVEVLTEIKQNYPDIVRILLTGYADLEAVEASLNEAQVFKYLMKPCPADEVRSAVKSGLERCEAPQHTAEVITLSLPGQDPTPISKAVSEKTIAAPVPNKPAKSQVHQQGNIVLLGNSELSKALKTAAPKAKIHTASNVDEVLALSMQHELSILVADIPTEETRSVSQALEKKLPHIITLIASERSDADVLIQLINSGKIFRFLLKPVQAGRLKLTLNSAFECYNASAPTTDFPPTTAEKSLVNKLINWLMGRNP